MKKVLIRSDGGNGIGMGHVMRMLVLAKELRQVFEVKFICKFNGTDKYLAGIEKIKEEGFVVKLIKEENIIENIINIQNYEKADLLITDSYDVDEEYFDILKKHFYKTAYMDDVNICRINTDIIINQNINALEYEYVGDTNSEKHLFRGSQYVLLREEFRHFKREKLNITANDIMLTIGGSDKDNLTIKVIELLKDISVNLHIIIGSAFEKNLIDKVYSYQSEAINVLPYRNANMSEIMKKCDLAISACGSTLYELSAMKVPTIGIVVASNQEKVAEFMASRELIINTKDLIYTNEELFKKYVLNLLYNFKMRELLINNSSGYINVNGAKKLSEEIIKLV